MCLNADILSEQKSFHEDVVTVLVKQLQQEESLPEERRPTTQARALYIKVIQIIQIFIQIKLTSTSLRKSCAN